MDRDLISSGEVFLVEVKPAPAGSRDPWFYVRTDETGEVVGTHILSEARHLRYRDADIAAVNLRARGITATVTDRLGFAVTASSVFQEGRELSDAQLVALIASGRDVVEVARELCIPLCELNRLLESVSDRFETMAADVKQFNEATREKAEMLEAEQRRLEEGRC